MLSHSGRARSRDGRAPVEDVHPDALFNARFFHPQPDHSHQHHEDRDPKGQPPSALIKAEPKSQSLSGRSLRGLRPCGCYYRCGSETIAQCCRELQLPRAFGTEQELLFERLAIRGAQALKRVLVRQVEFSQTNTRLKTFAGQQILFKSRLLRGAQPAEEKAADRIVREFLRVALFELSCVVVHRTIVNPSPPSQSG